MGSVVFSHDLRMDCMSTLTFSHHHRVRLDVWLAQELGLSRSHVQKKMVSEVLVNEVPGIGHQLLKQGDVITIPFEHSSSEFSRKVFEKQNRTAPQMKIIAETPDYIVVDKPVGIAVHGDRDESSETVVDQLLVRYPEITRVGESLDRPGIVHRLDKGVSGIMVVARTHSFFEHLKQQFQQRQVEKEYIAIVYGALKSPEGTIRLSLARSRVTHQIIPARPLESAPGIRVAHTEFSVLNVIPTHSLVQLFPRTGRTHQLRVHLKSISHPIVGDQLYTTRMYRAKNRAYSRMFLHAYRIQFIDQRMVHVQYCQEPPEDFLALVRKLFPNFTFRGSDSTR